MALILRVCDRGSASPGVCLADLGSWDAVLCGCGVREILEVLNQLEGLGNLSLVWKLFHPSPCCPVPDLTLNNRQVLPLSVCGLYFVFPLSRVHRLTRNIPALLSKMASLVHCSLSPLFVDFLAQILMSSFVYACIAFRGVTGVPVVCRCCCGGTRIRGYSDPAACSGVASAWFHDLSVLGTRVLSFRLSAMAGRELVVKCGTFLHCCKHS